MSRNTVVRSFIYSAIKIIKDKENYFQTCVAGFIHLPYSLDESEKESNKFLSHDSIETRKILKKGSWLNFQNGKSFTEMQLL